MASTGRIFWARFRPLALVFYCSCVLLFIIGDCIIVCAFFICTNLRTQPLALKALRSKPHPEAVSQSVCPLLNAVFTFMPTRFDELPVELYDAIFSFVEPPDLQHTILAVSRAIPFAALPLQHLFRSPQLKRPEQTVQLYNRIRPRRSRWKSPRRITEGTTSIASADADQPVAWVKELAVETWTVDADVLINLVRVLPNLQSLTLWVGPTNFVPEHLEELLSQPLEHLRYLSLRFRP